MKRHVHATIGPACRQGRALKEFLHAGVDVLRVNMSHEAAQDMAGLIADVHAHRPDLPIGADIRGRKLRIGPLPKGKVLLEAGDFFTFLPMEEECMGGPLHASVNYPALGCALSPGAKVYLDDGAYVLTVCETAADRVLCVVDKGGELPERSGFNLPGHLHRLPCLTGKDYRDLDLLSGLPVSLLYLSFVETAQDIRDLRNAQKERGMSLPVIAKIERSVAVDNIGGIAQAADGLCIARGDLGVEVPLVLLPSIQRKIVEAAKKAGKPVYLAGEVLFSLIHRTVPFRAEVTDVVTALEQGVDGFILSDETAVGIDPANALKALHSLINGFASQWPSQSGPTQPERPNS